MESTLPLDLGNLSYKLYKGKSGCLHSERYFIQDRLLQPICGACFFREGFISELPARMTFKEYSGLFGSHQMHPDLLRHLNISEGLIPPAPNENLARYRKRRLQATSPLPYKFPYISALWQLMGYQPPLARALVLFVQGHNEVEIAQTLDVSLFNVIERMGKAVHVGKRFLEV